MTEQELQALLVILNRAPMTPPEMLWIQALVARIAAQIKQEQARATVD